MCQHPLLRLVRYPPGLRQHIHAHAEASLTLLLDGRLRERVGRREVSALAGQWCHKAAGVDHATDFGPEGATTFQLRLPLGVGPASGPSWQWGCDPAVTGLLWALLGRGAAAVEAALLDDLGDLLRPGDEVVRTPPWWPRARQALCDGLVPIDRVATDCGVHRAHLVRVAQRLAGCTPVVMRQRARLGRSLARLVHEPGLPLGELALAAGYADQAHFNRECRRWLGLPPGRWRRHWAAPDAAVHARTSSSP